MKVRFSPGGDLGHRLHRNFDRLESEQYAPRAADSERRGLFQDRDYEWPADTEGRGLLAWVLLERATGRSALHLPTALALFDEFANSAGYFGALAKPSLHDEQQLAGHGWLLRALCEIYADGGDPSIRARIETIVRELALPTAGAHAEYPIDPAARNRAVGGVIGEAAEVVGSWWVSTDIGCDFIFLDGLAHAATLLNLPALHELVEEVIARFLQVDLLAIEAQTHATLTGVRALLRWHHYTGRPDLLLEAIRRFGIYKTVGMSENSGNWNWFGRPTHTEPCAVVDSFMIACQLWELTDDALWLSDAHEIYYNGLGHAQRFNGGFGCDTVLGATDPHPAVLTVALDEAWWCCTMRGAEGLATANDFSARLRQGELAFPFFFSGLLDVDTTAGQQVWRCESAYPQEGRMSLTYESGPDEAVTLAFWAPAWADGATVKVRGELIDVTPDHDDFIRCTLIPGQGDTVEYEFGLAPRWAAPRNESTLPCSRRLMRGPIMFGAESAQGARLDVVPGSPLRWDAKSRSVIDLNSMTTLSPLTDMIDRSSYIDYARQALFSAPPLAV
ncbi:beta-L-arabinofuranosidase domain-containing protein [Psychromicrobium xiongbiense]|uniref:beta-L-arabinofuranosidase domain-containing protein n=1 Tax=Psychromicrobium xiongbiense TaxID=3051184 RepID=UPI002556B5B6|nr:beta-L-arabinofuranosidase domain-containing protein [Psychromicrobium sp. YIM S02556]